MSEQNNGSGLGTKPRTMVLNPVEPGDFKNVMAEYGRQADVQKVFGLKRGSTYNLLNDGKIKGVLLRVRGNKSGIRLFHMESIRHFIESQMSVTEAEQPK